MSLFCHFVALLLLPTIAHAWPGKVVNVSDGDTITVLHEGRQERIRIYGIDCPEKDQPFGQKARDLTASMVAGRTVDVEEKDTDRYGRIVGLVSVDGTNLNESIVRNGFAWVYPQYCKESFCVDWSRLESAAKQQKKGMWADNAHIIPPWDWRHSEEVQPQVAVSKSTENDRVEKERDIAGSFHGNVNSHKFHRSGCQHYNCKNCTAIFGSRAEAVAAGYSPCGICRP